MSAFRDVRMRDRAAPRVVAFPPSIFASAWADRPTVPVDIGLRVPADHEVSLARANAARLAIELHPKDEDREGRIDAFNDALVRELCAASMCAPANVFEPFFGAPEDDVRTKLTSEGAKAVFDEVERLVVETSPIHREASDDEMAILSEALLDPEAIDQMPAIRAKRFRRLAAFLFDEIAKG